MRLSAKKNDNGKIIRIDFESKNGKISITSRYLIDALNNIDNPEISIGFTEGINKSTGIAYPMVIKKQNSDDYIHIIMPLTI